jgi:3-oxoadipate enol-lactonase
MQTASGKTKVNGLNMFYEIIGEGQPVVFIAGIASEHLQWKPAHVPAFTSAGYQCVIFDNRDVGQTDESPITSYTIKQFADDTAELLRRLHIDRAHIFGESMGGMIAQEFAINYPEMVRSLTLICTTPYIEPFFKAQSDSWRNVRRKLTLEESFQTIGLWLYSSAFYENPEAEKMFLDDVKANPHPQSVAAFERQLDAILSHNTLDRLNQIKSPTHVIGGDADILFPLRLSRILAERIPGAKLTVIPNGAHVLAFENPDEFNRVALNFLNQH